MKAIVTGATGFIGLALCRELLKNGYGVIAVIRPNSERKDRLSDLGKEDVLLGTSLRVLEIPLEKTEMLHTCYHVQADFFSIWPGMVHRG